MIAEQHINKYKTIGNWNCEVVAGCDIDPARLNAVCDKYNIGHRLESVTELIQMDDIDAVKGTLSIEHHSANLELERVEWQLASVRAICAELEQEGLDAPAKKDY